MILERIVAEKQREVAQAKEKVSLAELKKKSASFRALPRGFKQAIAQTNKLGLIAEIKKASPSKGVLRADFDPIKLAKSFKEAGACALSILTDKKFFQGELAELQAVRRAIDLPILRKDFIIDEYQVYESLSFGADAILLIVKILSLRQLQSFYALSTQLKLAAVCEVQDQEDLNKLVGVDAEIIGINNRNLDTFAEDLTVSAKLIKQIPRGRIVIAESAIKTRADVKFLQGLGVNAVLIGEAFMRSHDIKAKVKELMGYCQQAHCIAR